MYIETTYYGKHQSELFAADRIFIQVWSKYQYLLSVVQENLWLPYEPAPH